MPTNGMQMAWPQLASPLMGLVLSHSQRKTTQYSATNSGARIANLTHASVDSAPSAAPGRSIARDPPEPAETLMDDVGFKSVKACALPNRADAYRRRLRPAGSPLWSYCHKKLRVDCRSQTPGALLNLTIHQANLFTGLHSAA